MFLSSGDEYLDKALFNSQGLYSRGITEISGLAGSGKTQFLLRLLLFRRSVYISTEGEPHQALRRLQQLNSELFGNDEVRLERIIMLSAQTVSELNTLLDTENLFAQCELVVIDSIGALFRSGVEYSSSKQQMIKRSNDMLAVAAKLKKLNRCIVLSNQVSCDLTTNTVVPALGLSWSHCVNTRIMINVFEDQDGQTIRQMEIKFSNLFPERKCFFKITSKGITAHQQ